MVKILIKREANIPETSAPVSNKAQTEQNGSKIEPDYLKMMVKWILLNFDNCIFENLRNNPDIQLLYSSDRDTINIWLENNIKALFSEEDINLLLSNFKNNIEITLDVDLSKKSNSPNIEAKSKTSQPALFELEKILNKLFKEEIYADTLHRILKEAAKEDKIRFQEFLTGFIQGWSLLKYSLKLPYSNEESKVEGIHKISKEFFRYISGIELEDRNLIIEAVTNYINAYLENYIIVSPEISKVVNLEIHNAAGFGKNTFSEGASFCVINKQTKRAIYLADII